MTGLGKAILAGLIAGAIAGLITYGVSALIWKGVDPERHALSLTLIVTFLFGTVTCGIAAARFNPPQAFGNAALAAIGFEVVLLVVARPGLNLRAAVIAFAAAVLFALIGAAIGLPRKAPKT
jgi:hypothetical protein